MPSLPKHMENESAVNPSLDNMLGTDIINLKGKKVLKGRLQIHLSLTCDEI